MKSTIDYYNKTAQSQADNLYGDEAMLPYLKAFLDYLPKNPKILDLCCGLGHECMRLNKLGAEVIGLDLSEQSIKIAKEMNPNLRFFVQNMLEDYSYVGRVDGVLCCAGLIHLNNEEMAIAFKQIDKVLKKGGYVHMVVRDGICKNPERAYEAIDGEARHGGDFICHTLDEVRTACKGVLALVKELSSKSGNDWRYYIFKK